MKMSRILPILFNTDMVRAILDGNKTVTRRICKDADDYCVPDMSFFDTAKRTYAIHSYADKEHMDSLSLAERTCPICPGDILYVRETWHKYTKRVGNGERCRLQEFYGYKASIANSEDASEKWHPSIHMPKEAARIWLKVTNVRVERLQDITIAEMIKEGCSNLWIDAARPMKLIDMAGNKNEFTSLWNSTIRKSDLDRYGWTGNPWVWVIEFERCDDIEIGGSGMNLDEAIEILKNNFPKTCKMVDGRYKGGFDDTECEFGQALLLSISTLEEIKQYRTIGTVEECREARERQKEKKPKPHFTSETAYSLGVDKGWNDCIDEILKRD